ncbi:putative membrane protein, partial [Chlamydia psittaci 84-8471/1]
SNF